MINDTRNPINYYLYNFSKLKLNHFRNATGSCRPPKLTKEKNLAPILFATMRHENTKVFLKTLLDSRAGASLISRKYCTTLAAREEKAHWVTIAGKFSTKGTVETQFQLTKLNPTATITYNFHVAESLGIYDMIMGRDLLNQLGLTIDFSTTTVTWEEASVPMK